MNPSFKDYLLEVTGSTDCSEVEIIQSLWSGYGKISRYQLYGASTETVVVKQISLMNSNDHPRGRNTDRSHDRKVRSYQVESHWYTHWNEQCTEHCRTAEFIGSFELEHEQWIILEDLDTQFPLRKHEIKLSEIKACLKWLAHFHSTFLGQEPTGLWEVGSYWHLDTRPDELEKVKHQELRSRAVEIDELLKNCSFQTIIHGDAKLANFCFSDQGESIAAVDFQYVGRGCGMKDVAYFLGSCLNSSDCEVYEKELLDFYFVQVRQAIDSSLSPIELSALELEWRRMYPIAWTDFTRFMLGWMPSHQKIHGYSLRLMESVLSALH